MAGANTYDFLGEGTVDPSSVQKPYDPNDEPNPANPGGISNNELDRRKAENVRVNDTSGHNAAGYSDYQETRQEAINAGAELNHNIRLSSAGQANNGFAAKLVPNLAALALGAFNPLLGVAATTANKYLLFDPADKANEKSKNAAVNAPYTAPPPRGTTPQGGAGTGVNNVGNYDPQAKSQELLDQANGSGPDGPAPRTDAASNDVKVFLDQERNRKQPSEAEALLNKTADRIQAQALGIAAGARGGAAARERATAQAITGNAAVGAQATQDLAVLRAKEDAARHDRLLAIMNLLSANAGRGDLLGSQYATMGTDIYGRGLASATSLDTTNANNATSTNIATGNNASNERIGSAHDAHTTSERKDQEPGFVEGVASNPIVQEAGKKLIENAFD